jgi:hypothetical protein
VGERIDELFELRAAERELPSKNGADERLQLDRFAGSAGVDRGDLTVDELREHDDMLLGGERENLLAALELRRVDSERTGRRDFVDERLKEVRHGALSADERRQAQKAHARLRPDDYLLVERFDLTLVDEHDDLISGEGVDRFRELGGGIDGPRLFEPVAVQGALGLGLG